MDYSKYKELELTFEDRLLTIKINRPESRNALTSGLHREFEEIWQDVAVDDSIGAIIVTGAGDRAFCAGVDMKSGLSSASDGARRSPARSFVGAKRLIANMLEVEQPIIGAINGDAVGLGASIAFSTDILFVNENARLADTHVKNLGVVCGDGGTVTWPLMMGIHKAKEYLLTGDFLHARDAERLGIINYALPPEEVMPRAREMALRMANGPTWALRWTKTSINKIMRDRLNLTMDTALATEWLTLASDDHKEAVAAFLEKREPKFTGQ